MMFRRQKRWARIERAIMKWRAEILETRPGNYMSDRDIDDTIRRLEQALNLEHWTMNDEKIYRLHIYNRSAGLEKASKVLNMPDQDNTWPLEGSKRSLLLYAQEGLEKAANIDPGPNKAFFVQQYNAIIRVVTGSDLEMFEASEVL